MEKLKQLLTYVLTITDLNSSPKPLSAQMS